MANCVLDNYIRDFSARGIGLAIAFGAVWLAGYRPPLFKKPWLWAVLVSSALLTVVAVCFIESPLLKWIDDQAYMRHWWRYEVLHRLFFLGAVPLVGGLVQEGAKMVPVVVWWRRSERSLDPKLGLVIGAVAGAGFGILQAYAVLATKLWGAFPAYAYDFFNPSSSYGFLCTFFPVAAQTAFSSLAGDGLATGRGWQFYLIASALHGLLNLAWKLFPGMCLASIGWPCYSLRACVYTAVLAVLATAWALWLRWRKTAVATGAATSAS